MSLKNIRVLLVIFFILGLAAGYISFSTFPDVLLPGAPTNYTLTATDTNKVFITQSFYSVLMALAFASVPLSALLASRSPNNKVRPATVMIFTVVMIFSYIAGVIYYQNYFTEMFSALGLQAGVAIKLDIIPYYKISLLSLGATIITGSLASGYQSIKQS